MSTLLLVLLTRLIRTFSQNSTPKTQQAKLKMEIDVLSLPTPILVSTQQGSYLATPVLSSPDSKTGFQTFFGWTTPFGIVTPASVPVYTPIAQGNTIASESLTNRTTEVSRADSSLPEESISIKSEPSSPPMEQQVLPTETFSYIPAPDPSPVSGGPTQSSIDPYQPSTEHLTESELSAVSKIRLSITEIVNMQWRDLDISGKLLDDSERKLITHIRSKGRNRKAAKQCRDRKITGLSDLEIEVKELKKRITDESSKYVSLYNERQKWKGQCDKRTYARLQLENFLTMTGDKLSLNYPLVDPESIQPNRVKEEMNS